ncbi:uncharacterized protein [Watersipora subatra]|uniref:uncharacterized protein isoform X2 n=1 Tax=Watersipora subatra TaxID=2589382 RepID=UPI00355B1A01
MYCHALLQDGTRLQSPTRVIRPNTENDNSLEIVIGLFVASLALIIIVFVGLAHIRNSPNAVSVDVTSRRTQKKEVGSVSDNKLRGPVSALTLPQNPHPGPFQFRNMNCS